MSKLNNRNQQDTSSAKEVLQLIWSLLSMLLIVFFIRGSMIQSFRIPSSSMETTLLIGDYLFANRLRYGFRLPYMTKTLFDYSEPQRGQIVIFTRPDDPQTPNDDSADYIIKRVVGVAGDKVEVKGTKLFVNDKESIEQYARWTQGGVRDFGPAVVPPGKVFLMGDNRDYSLDGRFWTEHFLDVSRIEGQALFIFWNFDYLSRIFKGIR